MYLCTFSHTFPYDSLNLNKYLWWKEGLCDSIIDFYSLVNYMNIFFKRARKVMNVARNIQVKLYENKRNHSAEEIKGRL